MAIKIDPRYKEAYYYKGNALDEIGEHKSAIKYYDMAIQID